MPFPSFTMRLYTHPRTGLLEPIFRFHSPPALVAGINGIAWESRQQVGCSREILLIEQVLNREGEAQIGASNVVHADPGVHYVIGRQILAILRAKFRSMEPVTVQNEFAVERPHRKHPVRSDEHTSELPSLMRNSHAVFCLKK